MLCHQPPPCFEDYDWDAEDSQLFSGHNLGGVVTANTNLQEPRVRAAIDSGSSMADILAEGGVYDASGDPGV